MTNLADMSEGFSDRDDGGFSVMGRAVQVRKLLLPTVDDSISSFGEEEFLIYIVFNRHYPS